MRAESLVLFPSVPSSISSNPSFFFFSHDTPAISSLRLRATGLSLAAGAAAAAGGIEEGKAATAAGRSETGGESEGAVGGGGGGASLCSGGCPLG